MSPTSNRQWSRMCACEVPSPGLYVDEKMVPGCFRFFSSRQPVYRIIETLIVANEYLSRFIKNMQRILVIIVYRALSHHDDPESADRYVQQSMTPSCANALNAPA